MGVNFDCCVEYKDDYGQNAKCLYYLTKFDSSFQFISIDLSTDEQFLFTTKLPLLKNLSNCSQLIVDDVLFLCGLSDSSFELEGSYLFSIEIDSILFTCVQPQMLISSIFPHRKPSLCRFNEEKIMVVGGKNTKKSEYYNIRTNRWRILPDLPSVRFGCSLVEIPYQDKVIVVGGIDERGVYLQDLLTIDTKYHGGWDKLNVDLGSPLERFFCGIYLDRNGEIMLLGGNASNKTKNEIFCFDLQGYERPNEKIELDGYSEFIFVSPVETKSGDMYFVNTNYEIFKVNRFNDEVEKSACTFE